MLDGALTAFQGLQHPLLKRRQLGSGLVHRSPRTLFRGIHEPLCLVLRFKSHGRLTVLHQKLHTQLDDVRKSILSSRPEPEKLPENLSDPAGVEPLGQINWHEKAVESPELDRDKWSCCHTTKFGHRSTTQAQRTRRETR